MTGDSDPCGDAKERDEHTCQKCGYTKDDDTEMKGHFIVPLDAGGAESVDNVATLCPPCYRYAPDEFLESDAYEPVFEEYIETDVRPEADFAYFGVLATEKLTTAYCGTTEGLEGAEIDTEDLLDSIQTVVDSIRNLPERTEVGNPAYYWIQFAQFAEYGCVPDAEPITPKYIDETAD